MQETKRILHLTLKKKWFDMIASGEKKEEYREIKRYWTSRLVTGNYTWNTDDESVRSFMPKAIKKQFDLIEFINGYATNAPKITIECKGIEVGKAKPEWSDNWQGDVFIIKLGDIISVTK